MPKVVPGYKEAAKSKIVETALEVFQEKGFDDASMDDIAEKLGVSKGALYQYFGSKDDLLGAVSAVSQQMMREELSRSFEGRDFSEGLRVFFDWVEERFARNYPILFEWFAESFQDDRIKKLIREDERRDLETFGDFLEEQRRKGTLKTKMDSRSLVQLFETVVMGAWLRMAMGHNKSEILRSLKDVVALIESRH